MKLKVTEKGVSQDGKDIDVGEVLTIKGDVIPPSLVGKVAEVEGGRTAIINPDNGGEPKVYEEMTRADLDALAAERGVETKDAKNKGDVIAALQLADEAAKAA